MATYDLHGISRYTEVRVAFDDGSKLRIVWLGSVKDDDTSGYRHAYAHVLTDAAGVAIDLGADLRSPVSGRIDLPRVLGAWLSFALADSEAYRRKMEGTPMETFAYDHGGELESLADEVTDRIGH